MLGVTEKIMLGTSEDSLDHEALQAEPVAAPATQDGNARTTACGYFARGWAPLPIPRGAKAPTLPDWQKNKIKTVADVSRHFGDGPSNIGILLGAASAGLTDADLDWEEAVRLADGYLPRTASTFGRLSKPRSHRLYVASGINRDTFADPESKELYLELRGNRCQTMFPGSAHPTGEFVEWYESGSPLALDAAELRAATGRLAAASMLLRFSPEKGRHDYLLAVSAVLVRAWGAERAQAFLEPLAVAMLTDRPKQAAGEVRRMVDGAAERLEGDEPVGGWPKLAETLGDKRTTKLAEGLSIERPADDVSDDTLALELGREWDGTAKHVALWGRWLFWTGSKWERDEKLHHLTGVRAFLREKVRKLPPAAGALRSARTVADVASLLRSNEELVGGVDQWDRDPWQLNTPAGIVDLRIGEIGPSDPLAYCTKSTAVAPAPSGTPLAGLPRAHLPPRPGADRLHATRARLRAHRPHDRARPDLRLGPGRERQGDVVQHRLPPARRLRGRGPGRPAARHPVRPAPDRHGHAARGAAGDRAGAGARAGVGRAEAEEPDRRRPDHRPVH